MRKSPEYVSIPIISQETILLIKNPVWLEISCLCNLARVSGKVKVPLLTSVEREILFCLAARFNSQDRERKFRRYHEIVERIW